MATTGQPILEHFGKPITVSIFGTVVDEFGLTLSDVTVTVRSGKQALKAVSTDADGRFEFLNLGVKVGIHSIESHGRGYHPTEEKLTIIHDLDERSLTLFLRLRSVEDDDFVQIYDVEPRIDYSEKEIMMVEPTDDPAFSSSTRAADKLRNARKFDDRHIFYATDRNRLIGSSQTKMFGGSRSTENQPMSFGVCAVSVPRIHKIGKIERPKVFKLQFSEDENKHIIFKSCELWESDTFFREVSTKATNSPDHSAFIFIHGFLVTFPEAILRTAQIATDLEFEGVAICYSWSSGGQLADYFKDEEDVHWTTKHLSAFLKTIVKLAGVSTVHVIAHSMGNRALIRALEEIANGGNSHNFVHQVIMAAPDVDVGEFKQVAEAFTSTAKLTTLYASSNDRPLIISQQFHAHARVGESGDQIVIMPVMDTIDASDIPCDILGHSYYGTSRTILSDIYYLFRDGTSPPRFGLKKASLENKPYWILKQ